MPDLVQLSFRALDYATRPARFAVGTLLRFVREDEPEPEAPLHDHPQTAPEAPAPEPGQPSPKAARRAARHEPTKGEAAAIRQEQRAREWGEPAPKP